jgi:NADP-dependent 3-hydroxy acid dehydrogenase YdfG
VSAETPKLVWVAGVGASLGLGAAVARRFAKAGFSAVVTGRSAERIEGVAAEIREAYYQLHVQPRSTWTQELDLRPYKEPF